MPGSETIVLGRIVALHGIQGWVRIKPFGDDPQAWQNMPLWQLGETEHGPWREVRLSGFRMRGDEVFAAFADIQDRTAAEEHLKGRWIGASRQNLPAPAENEFYWDDLIGMTVVNTAAVSLGKVATLIETGANDVLCVVDETGTERLLPFVDAVVQRVDLEARRIMVDWEADW